MSNKERARRNVKLNVTDDISHMNITEEDYKKLEDSIDPELNKEDITLTEKEEAFIVQESKQNNLEPRVLRNILKKYKKEHGKAI
ncbi:hypothetical protein U8V72_14420 [Priestia filamentosa]|uniref:hypothetical protein n=1 Tax=Priestia filamentosa TaxID=1402861 RepID=UPI000589458B